MAQVNITTRDTHRTITKHRPTVRRQRKYSFSLAVFGLACLVFLVMGIGQLRQTSHFGSLFPLAEKLEGKAVVSSEIVSRYAKLSDEIRAGGYCRSDIVMAGATVILADLDRQDQDADYDAWAEALSRGERYFEHAISCTPTNGNYWLRLAMIRWAIAERPDEIATLMRESVSVAPAEQNVLMARLYFWNRLSAVTLEAASGSVENDVRIAVEDGEPYQLAPAMKSIGKNLAPYFRKYTQRVSPAKLALFKKAGWDASVLP